MLLCALLVVARHGEVMTLSQRVGSPINNLSVGASVIARSVHHLPFSASSEHSPLLAHSSNQDSQSVIVGFLSLLYPLHACPSGQSMLHLGAILGFHRLLTHLIQRGIDVDPRDVNGYTALHLLLYRVDWHVPEF